MCNTVKFPSLLILFTFSGILFFREIVALYSLFIGFIRLIHQIFNNFPQIFILELRIYVDRIT
ncbi:hypothetical protein CLI64_12075 [Nostoc sp. CENA543]|nr:hypothetical protein CLI64_12075 [Nostoc sp. CENA543]